MNDPSANRRVDWRFEQVLGNLLRAGVLLAAAVVLVGAGVYLARHGAEPPQYQFFRGEPSDLRSVGGVLRMAGSLSGRGIIQLGCLLLVATPIMRVAVSLAAFARARDGTYVLVTAIVLALLLVSLLGSG